MVELEALLQWRWFMALYSNFIGEASARHQRVDTVGEFRARIRTTNRVLADFRSHLRTHHFSLPSLLSPKYDLDFTFPVQANGFIEVQSPQRHDFVFAIQNQAMQLGALEPVVGRQVAGVVLQKQDRELPPR
jgi:hypothetical protein